MTIRVYHIRVGNVNITIVFIPKYRRRVLYGKIKKDVQEILKTLCRYKKVEIIAGAVCSDHYI